MAPITRLRRAGSRAPVLVAVLAAGLVVLAGPAPGLAQSAGSEDIAAELEQLPRNEALRMLGVKDPAGFRGPVSRLIPGRDGTVDSIYERQALDQLAADLDVARSAQAGSDPGTDSLAQDPAAGTDAGTRAGFGDGGEPTRSNGEAAVDTSVDGSDGLGVLQVLADILNLDQLLPVGQ